MRFITEFESTYEGANHPKHAEIVKTYEGRGQMELGNLIADSFGWNKNEYRFNVSHTLEIEAFPMDKWIEFKRNISTLIMSNCDELSGDVIKLLKELESYGKPSGDGITYQ